MTMTLRNANLGDAVLLWEWRNESSTREASFHDQPVPMEDHMAWFRDALEDPEHLICIGIVDGVPIGVVRVKPEDELGVISVTIAPEARGRRLAHRLIAGACNRWFASGGGPIRAEIKHENHPSRRAFVAAGFDPVSDGEMHMVLERRPPPHD